jgi:prenylated cyclic peptide (anacyclamide/piricyclamide family)
MTKKNLKPQQAAPVQREINTTSSVEGTGLTPLYAEKYGGTAHPFWGATPFAGDDAE